MLFAETITEPLKKNKNKIKNPECYLCKSVLEFITFQSCYQQFDFLMAGEARGYQQIIFTEASHTS